MLTKERLESLVIQLKPIIDQPLEGLLYDLDLLPEQLNSFFTGKIYATIVNMKEEINKLKNKEGE